MARTKTITLSKTKLKRARDERYRHKQTLRLKSADDAVKFVDELGFCFFWPITAVEMPSLWAAVAGDRRVAIEHDDPGHVTWGWKDESLNKRCWYYGKLLRRKGTLVSLKLLPAFYALSDNFGDPDDYLEEYRAGHLTSEAKSIYEVIRDNGPIDTVRLRREAHLASSNSKYRFDKALTDLQKGLKILPVGVAQAGAWGYAFNYELLDRWLPDIPKLARSITRQEARVELVRHYICNVFAAKPAAIARIFGWRKDEADAAIAELVASGEVIAGVRMADVKGEHVMVASLFN